MSSINSSDPSFRPDAESDDEMAQMTRRRASQAFESNEPSELDGAVEELIERNLDPETKDWSEVTRKVMRGIVESINDQDDADWAIRRASHRAVLAVARRWGNVVLAGKATVSATREAAFKNGLDGVRAAQQAGLGAIDGVRQVGPVAGPVLQRELTPMVQDFEEMLDEEKRSGEWMLRSLERNTTELPVALRVAAPEVQESLDLSVSDYEEAALEVEESDWPLVELEVPAVVVEPQVAVPEKPAPPMGLLQKAVHWLKSLFSRRDKKVSR